MLESAPVLGKLESRRLAVPCEIVVKGGRGRHEIRCQPDKSDSQRQDAKQLPADKAEPKQPKPPVIAFHQFDTAANRITGTNRRIVGYHIKGETVTHLEQDHKTRQNENRDSDQRK